MSDDPQYVQGGIFGGLTSQPIDWGAPTGSTPPNFNDTFGAFPSIPQLPGSFAPSATSKGNVVASAGGANSGAYIAPTTPQTAAPSNAQAGAQPSPAGGVVSGSLADYFMRAVIIILGFIFVAIGLNMFRPGIVPNPTKIVKGHL